WLHVGVPHRPRLGGCARAAHLWRHQRDHEGSDLARDGHGEPMNARSSTPPTVRAEPVEARAPASCSVRAEPVEAGAPTPRTVQAEPVETRALLAISLGQAQRERAGDKASDCAMAV